MKCEMTNTILTFVLGVLAVAGVIFALQTIFLTREFRQLTVQATVANNSLMQVQALANDVAAYNQKSPSPELTKLLSVAKSAPVPVKK
jgi:ABC-type transporter Mla subunit MlaD